MYQLVSAIYDDNSQVLFIHWHATNIKVSLFLMYIFVLGYNIGSTSCPWYISQRWDPYMFVSRIWLDWCCGWWGMLRVCVLSWEMKAYSSFSIDFEFETLIPIKFNTKNYIFESPHNTILREIMLVLYISMNIYLVWPVICSQMIGWSWIQNENKRH